MYKFGNPAKVNVLEEYLIYDFITMIGSIGGTLGLCIGFSFSNLFNSLISSFKVLTTKITLSSVKNDDANFRKDTHNEFEMKEELTSMKEALQKLEAKINGHYST